MAVKSWQAFILATFKLELLVGYMALSVDRGWDGSNRILSILYRQSFLHGVKSIREVIRNRHGSEVIGSRLQQCRGQHVGSWPHTEDQRDDRYHMGERDRVGDRCALF